MNGNTCTVTFTADRLRLYGTLHLPPDAHLPAPAVVGSHGLMASAESAKQLALAQACNRVGIAFLRFDHRGCGRSEGDFREVTSLAGRCADLAAAVATVRVRSDISGSIGLFGSSMGGATCLAMAGQLAVGPMVVVAAPIRSRSLQRASAALTDPATGLPPYDVEKMRFDISDRLDAIRHILVFHGEADDTVPVSHGKEIYRRAQTPKRLILQKGGDHLMSDPADQKVFIRETVGWFRSGLLQAG